MGVSEWAAWQAKRERRDSEKTQPVPVFDLYPTAKPDRRKPKEKK